MGEHLRCAPRRENWRDGEAIWRTGCVGEILEEEKEGLPAAEREGRGFEVSPKANYPGTHQKGWREERRGMCIGGRGEFSGSDGGIEDLSEAWR